MDNFQFWLYVIIAIIYVLAKALKKKPEDTEAPTEKRGQGGSTGKRPMTFEELLREITESKSTTTTSTPRQESKPYVSKPVQKPQPAYVDYDDNLEEEEQDLEDTNYTYKERDDLYQVYEEAKRQAFEKPSLEETLKLEDKELKYGRFEEFSKKKRKRIVDDYVAELRTPGGFKKAVVLSEILNRRF